jgi:thiamine-phosphate pyrophosphorylase
MHRRQPLPRLWLMTDERQREGLWTALARVPRGAGVVFRHYGLAREERRRLFDRVKAVARRRGLILLLAGPPRMAEAWGADGSHGPGPGPTKRLRTISAHDGSEIRAARQIGADLVFLSPVFATGSHPGARPLGRLRFGLLARASRIPVIALGGMNRRKARGLEGSGIYGWAAIDAWAG